MIEGPIAGIVDAAAGLGCWFGAYCVYLVADAGERVDLLGNRDDAARRKYRRVVVVLPVLVLVGMVEIAKALGALPG